MPTTENTASPAMPRGLSAAEKACWRGILRELSTVPGLLARADRGVIELLARLEPMVRTAAATVRDHGATVTLTDADGHVTAVRARPDATFVLRAGALAKSLYAELGLSPSGRSRVALAPEPSSKLDSFLRSNRGA